MAQKEAPIDIPRLPAGYWLDEVTDPDVVLLRRPAGSVIAIFSARGATAEQIEEAAWGDTKEAN